jgi:hypothetical protein
MEQQRAGANIAAFSAPQEIPHLALFLNNFSDHKGLFCVGVIFICMPNCASYFFPLYFYGNHAVCTPCFEIAG